MSQELRVTRDGADRSIVAPLIHDGGVWKSAQKIYRRESGVWEEWWPLAPHAPTGLTGDFLYRNDQIELDVAWVAPAAGPDVDHYSAHVSVNSGSFGVGTTTAGLTWTPSQAWQSMAGQRAVITVYAVSPTGVVGEPVSTADIVIPQLPAPPDPTGVDVTISNRSATLAWAHGGGNRLSSFEVSTTYQGKTKAKTAGKTARSLNITHWSTAVVEGDPGGDVGSYIRAIGPGGSSDWVSDSGTIPYVPHAPPPPPLAPAVRIPGTPKITDHRFYLGKLIVDYTTTNASSVKYWYQKYGSDKVYVGTAGTSGRITIAASDAWPRDEVSRYRVFIQAISSGGTGGSTTNGAWARKLPNPYYVHPTEIVSVRGNAPYNDGLMRQGASYNSYDYLNPKIIWQSYALYGTRLEQAFARSRIGYNVTVTKGSLFMWRTPTGGSGSAVRPRIGYHTHTSPPNSGGTLYGLHDAAPMARDQLLWQTLNLAYSRALASPTGVRGVGIYHPNAVLLSWLGQVSAEYSKYRGPSSSFWGVPMWTVAFDHDG